MPYPKIIISQISGPIPVLEKTLELFLEKEIRIGRNPDSDIVIPESEKTISRDHVSISYNLEIEEVTIDNHGKLGTTINGITYLDKFSESINELIVAIGTYVFEITLVQLESVVGSEIGTKTVELPTEHVSGVLDKGNKTGKKVNSVSDEIKESGLSKPYKIMAGVIGIGLLLLLLIPSNTNTSSPESRQSASKNIEIRYTAVGVIKGNRFKNWSVIENNLIKEHFKLAGDYQLSNVPQNRWKAIKKWEDGFDRIKEYKNSPVDFDSEYAKYLATVEELNTAIGLIEKEIILAKQANNIQKLEKSKADIDRIIPDKKNQIQTQFRKLIYE